MEYGSHKRSHHEGHRPQPGVIQTRPTAWQAEWGETCVPREGSSLRPLLEAGNVSKAKNFTYKGLFEDYSKERPPPVPSSAVDDIFITAGGFHATGCELFTKYSMWMTWDTAWPMPEDLEDPEGDPNIKWIPLAGPNRTKCKVITVYYLVHAYRMVVRTHYGALSEQCTMNLPSAECHGDLCYLLVVPFSHPGRIEKTT